MLDMEICSDVESFDAFRELLRFPLQKFLQTFLESVEVYVLLLITSVLRKNQAVGLAVC